MIIVFLRNFWYFLIFFLTENDGCGGGGGEGLIWCKWGDVFFLPQIAPLLATVSTFCRKVKNISQKQTYYQSKKSNKYFIIRRDLIDFFSSNNCVLFLSSSWLFRPKIICVLRNFGYFLDFFFLKTGLNKARSKRRGESIKSSLIIKYFFNFLGQ